MRKRKLLNFASITNVESSLNQERYNKVIDTWTHAREADYRRHDAGDEGR